MRDRASELRAIADGRLMLNVRNGVTVSRSMLARIADEIDAVHQRYVDANESRIDAEGQLAETAKELSLVRAERDRAQKACERIAALPSTGAVKVKALEWQEDANGCLHVQTELGEYVAWPNGRVQRGEFGISKVDGGIIGAKSAAQADYERRILSALEPHPRDTNTVDAHETTNVRDKPEGQQEPVAWMPPQDCDGKEQSAFEKWAEDAGFDMHEHPLHYLFMDHKTAAARQGWKAALAYVRSTFTRPSEQAVTEAAGEWRRVETSFQIKGRRRSPAYFPATGEECEVSGPNCDDDIGYTWGETTVLWQNEIFVLYGNKGYWPVLHKHEHVLFRPAALKAAMEAGG